MDEQITEQETTVEQGASPDALALELEQFDTEHDPDAQAKAQADADAEQADAEAEQAAAEIAPLSALVALMGIEQAIKTFVHPRFEIDDERRQQVARDCAPVLIKYGALLPDWLAQYEAEIVAIKAVGGLTIESIGQVKQLKAEDMARLRAVKADNEEHDAPQEADKEAA
ncbi:hypothetical protein [Salinivibrio sp. IB872]|uniref:hypothetical protein n=1 Tax=Salinivibrio sp. IB872 TaxID=1766123 RepID=UPI00098499AD|nr:hypothetical protein [Salinivibrio sp. IB872]OOF25729.1 hypothetical protein BZJ18_10990 [Salinivibrio sp. IB872]